MATYNKLVRDKIPDILDAKGISYEKRIATDEEYKIELIKKLGEEWQELTETGDIEELADVMEVVEALRQLPQYQNAEDVRLKKKEERGGFEKKFILQGEK